MAPQQRHIAALSRLFSSQVLRELAVRGKSATFARLVNEADVLPVMVRGSLVSEYFPDSIQRAEA
jgi:hypothetical protein